ncbi:fucose isomerase [Nesterenkonia haasae]|uniref:fucose isomerase n=1 Tax=Nesterenkonia haasae TaxID=2587813 RepID=UPI0013917637|nr:fucose isomerase [Nesterenkonia haasae]NDK31109.1 fucose isomerase [Nesterenkonia haasae]
MNNYTMPHPTQRPVVEPQTVYLVSSGDQRESANIASWNVQQQLEAMLTRVISERGFAIVRANEVDSNVGHGFINSQRMGLEVFARIPREAPLVVAIGNWQYSSHVLPGLRTHEGPILTVANFDPRWPGLVGLLGLNGGLTKMGKAYSTLWTVDGTDSWFNDQFTSWLDSGEVTHDDSHVRELGELRETTEVALGRALGNQLLEDKAIIGVFDEGCMGMYNAIIDDELLNPIGIYKERLSQSELWAEMQRVSDDEAAAVGGWLLDAGMTFRVGSDEATELTENQLRWQYKMYIAALRLSDDFGLDAVGIQYQQGLKNLSPASDLVEGLLNNDERPPVTSRDGSRILWDGQALPHFNEVDEAVAVDALITNRVWRSMDLDPATTLHDVRWGEERDGEYVWTFEISGSVPASHLDGGYSGAEGWRQGPVFFPAGGATLNGVSKPGEIVWSRVYIENDSLHVDIGRGSSVKLTEEESNRRKEATNPEWPIMHAILHGVNRNQFMARHKANHVQVVYAPNADMADRALESKVAMFDQIGVIVHLCGNTSSIKHIAADVAPPSS